MKKNKMMRAGSAILVLVLLTISVICGTFAKYTTSGTSTDTARAAKFGVTVEASTDGGFLKEYDGTVTSSGDDKVVAPGTDGKIASFTVSGKPEVSVKVSYTLTTLTLKNWSDSYCPIVFTVGDATYGLTGVKDKNGTVVTNASTSVSALETAVKSAVNEYSQTFDPNTDLSGESLNISWNWAFENGKDAADTALGDAAAKGAAIPTISYEISASITQID